ncbi:DUF2934 domain-containing protein [Chthonobacter albigriseus]|uniref:DUF2934 domain-containing protein n=1 Tax=Chthonobacter albigriseus TaxID=1683161 RepID=UPI0015EF1B63|nr:DUF2934 domain-containing protein [Chthonobacter albigriseus]
MTHDTDREARIRERAHRIWESEGRPDDRAEVHWSIAARIVDEEDQAPPGESAENMIDEGIEESFPASDPPAMSQPVTSVRSEPPAAANDADETGSARGRHRARAI